MSTGGDDGQAGGKGAGGDGSGGQKASGNGAGGNGAGRGGPGFTVRDRRHWVQDGDEPAAGGAAIAGPAEERQPTYVAQLEADLKAAREAAAEKDARLREYIAAYKEQVGRGLEEAKDRLRREADKELELARGRLLTDLLEVLDNLERSRQAATETHRLDALLEGLGLVEGQFRGALAALGLERIPTVGEAFDPTRHEAVAVVPVGDPAQDRRIIAEVQAGYRLGNRVLRAARVTVGQLTSPPE